MEINQLYSFGDSRRVILDIVMAIRNKEVSASEGMSIAANMKNLNDNIQKEINVVKASILAREKGHDFGNIVGMGQKLIGNSSDQIA